MPAPQVVIRSGPLSGRRIAVDRPLVVGRTEADVVIDDTELSRRHAVLRPVAGGLVAVEDLGSTNGTILNGRRITGPATLSAGDRLTLGTTTLELADGDGGGRPAPYPGFELVQAEGAKLAYRPGTVGASMAADVADKLAGARERLAPLIARTGDLEPTILLVDPFPDPADPSRLVTRGSVVDAARGEIWIAVTAEAPPEPLERSLALLLGSRLPAGGELTLLLEGFAMIAARTPDPDPVLSQHELPALEQATGDLRPVMARSFVAFLIALAGEDAFFDFLAGAQPGQEEKAFKNTWRATPDELQERWRKALKDTGSSVETGQFLRLAVRYLRPYAWREVELFLLSLLALAFTVAFPFALRALLDTAIPSGDFGQVVTILVILGVAFAVALLASLRRIYQIAYIGSRVIKDIRLRMFERLQTLEPGWFTSRNSGDVVSRVITDVESLEVGLSQALREGIVQTLTLVVTAITLVILNPVLAAVVLLGAPVVALTYRAMGPEAQRRSLAAQQRVGDVTGVVAENLAGQPVVKAFGLERHEVDRFDDTSEDLFRSSLRLYVFGGLFAVSVEMITTLLRLIVLGLGAYLVIHGHLTTGGLVAFVTLMGTVLAPVTVLTTIVQQVQTSMGSLVRINEVLDSRPKVADREDAQPLPRLARAIELRGVVFSYTPERQVLHGVSATIPAGARAAFVGPSGAGKSSILQLLMRFSDPDRGHVVVDDTDIRRVTLASLRSQTGVVLQDTFLFNTTIRDNIRLGRPDATDAEVEAAGRAARLDEVVATMPEGWDAPVGERGARLSGGQRQRVAIARALIRDPAILLLDEATSALDPRTEHEIAETLEAAAAGRTTVAITHRLASIREYDVIFVVVDGLLAEQGTHDELIAARGAYAELWAEQHGELPPAAQPLDMTGALGQVPLFESLVRDELAIVADALRPIELRSGERLPEGGGRLSLVARGAGIVLVPAVGGGGYVQVAELRPGQAFGLSALLGEETGSVLEADGPLSLLTLDDQALAALESRFPQVRAVLAGDREAAPGPSSGVRLEPPSKVIDRGELLAELARGPAAGRASGGVHRILPIDGSDVTKAREVRR